MEETDLPKPSEISNTEKERALAAYLTVFATTAIGLPLPFLNFFAALAYHYFIRKTSPFVSFHSYQSLISQFIISIFNGVTVVWTVTNLIHDGFNNVYYSFLILTVILNLTYFIISFVAALMAYKGKIFYFLFFGRLAFERGYRSYNDRNRADLNTPPS